MTSTGIVRRIDGLGRIVLPKELRAILDLTTVTLWRSTRKGILLS